jgi:hypothetical protein
MLRTEYRTVHSIMISHIARLCRYVLSALSVGGLLFFGASSVNAAGNEALNDLSARIQFAYYAADARSLQRDLQSLKQFELENFEAVIQKYYLAYGYMRLAEVLGEKDRSSARRSASDCIKVTDTIVDQEIKRGDPKKSQLEILHAELWAIQGACIALEAKLSLLPETSLSSSKARRNATVLAPNNPRVKLLAAIHKSERADDAKDFAEANKELLAVTQLFSDLPTEVGLPDWGQADAWAWLGYGYLKMENSVAARNAIEQSLVLAPDYVWAKTLLAQTSRR